MTAPNLLTSALVWLGRLLFPAMACLILVPAPTKAGDDDILIAAAKYLDSARLPSGLFDFDMDFVSGKKELSNEYLENKRLLFIARQAGAAYGLAKYYYASRDDSVREALANVLAALTGSSIPMRKPVLLSVIERTRLTSLQTGQTKIGALLNSLGLLYHPEGNGKILAYGGDYKTAFSGSTALALMAEILFAAASGDERFREARASWLEGLMSFRVVGNGFRAVPHLTIRNGYADGEAWMALALHNELLPSHQLARLDTIDDTMMNMYAGQRSAEFFHWGMMAAASRLRTTSNAKFVEFIAHQADDMLAAGVSQQLEDDNTCAMVEGLAAAAGALQGAGGASKTLVQRLSDRIKAEMSKNRSLQIRQRQDHIDLSEGAYLSAPQLSHYAGAFLAGRARPYTRIDLTQHCMSAIIEMQRLRTSEDQRQ
jgi:hypothetical protein